MKKAITILSLVVISFFLMYKVLDFKPIINKNQNIKGIDISHHNKITDWSEVSKTSTFCLMKATEGKSHKDKKFISNWDSSKKHNMVRGAYHFFSPNVSAEKQFKNYQSRVTLQRGDFPPILDVELKECDIDEVNKWLEMAENHYGVKPIVYTTYMFFKVFMDGRLKDYPIWIYMSDNMGIQPSFDDYKCVLWQYNQKGRISGISGNVDLNYFLGDNLDLKNILIK